MQLGGACGLGSLDHGLGIVDDQQDPHRATAHRLGTDRAADGAGTRRSSMESDPYTRCVPFDTIGDAPAPQ
jgi:hypothetical protein